MPLIIGYATKSEINTLKKEYEVFRLRHEESQGLGIKPIRKSDLLVMTYIPMSKYEKMNPENWDNTYIIDERNKQEQLELGF